MVNPSASNYFCPRLYLFWCFPLYPFSSSIVANFLTFRQCEGCASTCVPVPVSCRGRHMRDVLYLCSAWSVDRGGVGATALRVDRGGVRLVCGPRQEPGRLRWLLSRAVAGSCGRFQSAGHRRQQTPASGWGTLSDTDRRHTRRINMQAINGTD